MIAEARDGQGRFAPGNGGGPGRPRRDVESRYMAALGDSVSLNDWREIVCRAVQDAKDGDSKSRDWLARFLLGSAPPTLLSIAAEEQREADENDAHEDEIDREATKQRLEQRREERQQELQAVTFGLLDRLPKKT